MAANTNPLESLSNQDLERMYPELYQKIKPYIDDIAEQFRNQKIDPNMLESIIQDILNNSGLSAAPGAPGTPMMPGTPMLPSTPGTPMTPSMPSAPGGCPGGTCPTDVIFDDYDDMDAIEVQRFMDYGNMNRGYPRPRYSYPNYNRRRRYPNYPVYPNYRTIYPQDLIRVLLFRQLFGYNPYY